MNKNQLTNLIGAGTIAAMMLILGLVFSGSGNLASANPDTSPAVAEMASTADSTLQAENQNLRETVQLMQEREALMIEQINIANEQLAAPAYGEGDYEGHEEGEEHEEEYEEEYEEHGEEYEMEEHEEEHDEDEYEDDDEDEEEEYDD